MPKCRFYIYFPCFLDSNTVGICFRQSWSPWQDSGAPSREGEDELLSEHRIENSDLCAQPIGMQIEYINPPSRRIPWNTFALRHSVHYGVSCKNKDQMRSRTCPDFKVRYCCPGQSTSKFFFELQRLCF